MYSSGSASLRLHFYNFNLFAKNVLSVFSSPFVHAFSHRRRRCDRIDSCYLGEGICHMCGSSVTIHGLEFSHLNRSPSLIWVICMRTRRQNLKFQPLAASSCSNPPPAEAENLVYTLSFILLLSPRKVNRLRSIFDNNITKSPLSSPDKKC